MVNFLDLHAISKRFGGVVALRNVDLALPAGEVHCLVGENGSGKSTLIKIIAGVLRPEPEGRIVIEGREYPHLNPVQSTACGIQVIYQDLSLFPNLTVAENIAVGRHLGPAAPGELAHDTAQPRKRRWRASAPRSILSRASRISRSRAANWWRSVARWRPTRGS